MTILELHEFLDAGRFENLLEYELSESLLISYDDSGTTAINKIADAKKTHYIPTDLLTECVLFSHSKAEEQGTQDEAWSGIDCIIRHDQFYLLPDSLKTREILMHRQSGGWLPLHIAASFGKLNQLPSEVITTENLRTANDFGTHCFHLAALNNNLQQIPSNIISTDALLDEDEDKVTALEYAFNKNREQLLGLALDERCRPIIGDYLDTIMQLHKQLHSIDSVHEETGLDLF